MNNILVNGLLINSKNNGFVKKTYLSNYHKKYGIQPIFLTNDIDYIVKTQLTKEFIKDCAILKIIVDDIKIEDEYEYLNKNWNLFYTSKEKKIDNLNGHFGKCFICKENIKRELINYEGRFDEIANSFKTFDEIYEHLLRDDFSVIDRKCGTNEYPQINWMIDVFLKTEDYEKCEFLKNLKLPKPSKDKLNNELKWLKLNI